MHDTIRKEDVASYFKNLRLLLSTFLWPVISHHILPSLPYPKTHDYVRSPINCALPNVRRKVSQTKPKLVPKKKIKVKVPVVDKRVCEGKRKGKVDSWVFRQQ